MFNRTYEESDRDCGCDQDTYRYATLGVVVQAQGSSSFRGPTVSLIRCGRVLRLLVLYDSEVGIGMYAERTMRRIARNVPTRHQRPRRREMTTGPDGSNNLL